MLVGDGVCTGSGFRLIEGTAGKVLAILMGIVHQGHKPGTLSLVEGFVVEGIEGVD